jgi:hypothetical protein
VKKPPISGPATLDTPNTAPNSPTHFPRSRGGTTSPIAAWAETIRPPPPSPCTARKAISSVMPLRLPAQRGAGQEQHERRLQHDLAAVQVAELAVQRRHRGHRQQVRGHDPRDVLEAPEVAHDRRQRRGDDGLVQRGEEHHHHQAADDEQDRPPIGRPGA